MSDHKPWPASAEDWAADASDATELDEGWKRHDDDPRPNVGISCGGRYFPDDATRGHAFECNQCALRKTLRVADEQDRRAERKFACPACRDNPIHQPVGIDPRLIRPFDTTSSDHD